MDWTAKRCVPCHGGVPKIPPEEARRLVATLDGWELRGERLHRTFRFRDFREAMRFVSAMADLAEAEGHHPDFSVHYSTVEVEIWTHAVGGLSENDFILAAKIGTLPGLPGKAGIAPGVDRRGGSGA
ncbi:MAG TPA: 4a-hydroxytetrahydrobiopterin dehydratase [Anaeromyxobacteraceae bacterium]|nr:4a-hydroxytetrahydrobiopterin dehydratase [Anaeromyxobacteraceae bacterium]